MKKKELSHGARHGQRKLSTREIVAATNLSQQRVQQRLKRGESGPEIIAAVQSRKQAEQSAVAEEKLHRSRTGGTAAPAPLSFSVRKKTEADAALKQLELATKRGELIPVAQVNNWMASAIMRARDIWLGLRDLSDRIRQEADPIAAQRLIDSEIRRGLLELERFCARMSRKVAAGGDGGTRD